jgi:hypothetical protein
MATDAVSDTRETLYAGLALAPRCSSTQVIIGIVSELGRIPPETVGKYHDLPVSDFDPLLKHLEAACQRSM